MPNLAEDRDAIRDLYARYCHLVDSGASDAWAAMFTDDGEFQTGGPDPIVGHDALRSFAAALPAGALHHMATDLAIEVDGDRATCTSSLLVMSAGAIVTTGRSSDELRRAHDAWLIARRVYTPDSV